MIACLLGGRQKMVRIVQFLAFFLPFARVRATLELGIGLENLNIDNENIRHLDTKPSLENCLLGSESPEVILDLFIVTRCGFSEEAGRNLLKIVSDYQELVDSRKKDGDTEIYLSLTPVQCVPAEDNLLYNRYDEDQLYCDEKVFYRDVNDARGLQLVCFQDSENDPSKTHGKINKDFYDFLGCIYGSNTYSGGASCEGARRSCMSNSAQINDQVLAATESAGIDDNPILFVNGQKYCGSFSEEELSAAICAANEKYPPSRVSNSNKKRGMPWSDNIRKEQSCSTWWNESGVEKLNPNKGICLVTPDDGFASFLPILLTAFFLVGTIVFVCVVMSRHRLDTYRVEQRRLEGINRSRFNELLQILELERNFSSRNNNQTKTAEQIEEILKNNLKTCIYSKDKGKSITQVAETNVNENEKTKDTDKENLSDINNNNNSPDEVVSSINGNSSSDEGTPAEVIRSNSVVDINMQGMNNPGSDTCPICLDILEDGAEYYDIDCGHISHKDCLIQWMLKKNECPFCRGMISPLLENPQTSSENVSIELTNITTSQNQNQRNASQQNSNVNSSPTLGLYINGQPVTLTLSSRRDLNLV